MCKIKYTEEYFMKKVFFLTLFSIIAVNIFAIDPSLIGEWGCKSLSPVIIFTKDKILIHPKIIDSLDHFIIGLETIDIENEDDMF